MSASIFITIHLFNTYLISTDYVLSAMDIQLKHYHLLFLWRRQRYKQTISVYFSKSHSESRGHWGKGTRDFLRKSQNDSQGNGSSKFVSEGRAGVLTSRWKVVNTGKGRGMGTCKENNTVFPNKEFSSSKCQRCGSWENCPSRPCAAASSMSSTSTGVEGRWVKAAHRCTALVCSWEGGVKTARG